MKVLVNRDIFFYKISQRVPQSGVYDAALPNRTTVSK